jgi:curved DNA-binding protein
MYEQAGAGAGGGNPFAGGGNPFGGGWNVNTGAGSGGYRTMTEEEMRDLFGGSSPFSDFFQTFFGGAPGAGAGQEESGRRAGRGRPRARPGRDLEQDIELPLEDAFKGTTRRFSLALDGTQRSFDVRIPSGVSEGSRVRVAGEGEPGAGGGKAGDLYLRIRLTPNPQFDLKGRDLYTKVAVPLTTAVLGGEADVTTLGGKSLRLKIPATTQNGQVFRLKGHGMPTAGKADSVGDLYATVDVQLPKTLTPEQQSHFEALQKLDRGGTAA